MPVPTPTRGQATASKTSLRHYWLFFVPFYNIYLGLVLLFTRGVQGNNQYGPDPATA